PNDSNPRELANANGTLIFRADDGTHGREPWILSAAKLDDIAGRARQNGQWLVGVSSGSSFNSSSWATWSTGTNWINVLSGDFNGDGLSYIAGWDLLTG